MLDASIFSLLSTGREVICIGRPKKSRLIFSDLGATSGLMFSLSLDKCSICESGYDGINAPLPRASRDTEAWRIFSL